jgi:SAM-dependent methyltransferase
MGSRHNLKRLVPAAFKRLYHRSFRMVLRIRCWIADRSARPELETPLPPAMLRFRVSESLDEELFFRVGEGCARHIEREVSAMGVDLRRAERVLDFGCGCGRTIRWFLADPGATEFHGVDTDKAAVDWCAQHLAAGRFLTTAPEPPLPYGAKFFDVVYCLSVFTHLDEAMQDRWLPELSRVLKPGGVLLLSVHGENAVQALDASGRELLRTEGFAHTRSQKLKGLVPDWYQTSWHTQEYIVERVARWFEDVRYQVVPDGVQDIVVAKKSELTD